MKNDIYKYIKQYGNLSFNEEPINKIDYILFSILSYMNFSFVKDKIYSFEKTITSWNSLGEDNKFKGMHMMRRLKKLPNALLDMKRFKEISVTKYIEVISEAFEKQINAITFLLPNKKLIISYMGSDNSLFSWKEDFNMAFLDDTPAQIEALSYLNKVCELYNDYEINLCGYSKGGNLASYVAINSDKKFKKRINSIYSFDGPGFYNDVLNNCDSITNKIALFIPKGSIVGKLLKNVNYKSIKSRNFSIFQHEISSWKVKGKDLVYKKEASKLSLFIANKINNFVYENRREDIEVYINEIFMNIKNAGIIKMNDIRNKLFKFINSIISVLNKAKNKR